MKLPKYTSFETEGGESIGFGNWEFDPTFLHFCIYYAYDEHGNYTRTETVLNRSDRDAIRAIFDSFDDLEK